MKRRQGDNRLNRKMKRIYNPEIERVVEWLTLFSKGEGSNQMCAMASAFIAPGVLTYGMLSMDAM